MKWSVLRGMLIASLIAGAGMAAAQDERTVSDNVDNEAALIEILTGDAGWAEKQAACRSLRRIGTAASVPALAALLPDPELSHMARFALEVMPFPEAAEALRNGLASTNGLARIGVITSLGARRDEEAAARLAPMVKDGDMDIARAAAAALGRIANERALQALMDVHTTAPPRYRQLVTEALLTAAQRMIEDGKGEETVAVYQALLAPEQPESVRFGAFRGMAYAQPDAASVMLLAALKDDPAMRNIAGQLVAEAIDPKATAQYADALATLPAEAQVVLLRGLGVRGDDAARPAVLEAAKSTDKAVQLAALNALTTLGHGEDVAMLTGLIASGDDEIAGAARDVVAKLKHPDTDAAIVAALPTVEPALRAELLITLAGRGASESVTVATESLDDEAPEVRIAALEILGRLGTADQVPLILDAVLAGDHPEQFTPAAQALGALIEREGDAALKPLQEAFSDAEGDAKIAILRAIGRAATPKALETVLKAVNTETLKAEALPILADWPTTDAAPHLLKLAKASDPTMKDTILRGYVRLAQAEEDMKKKVEMLNSAMKLAKQPQEKWIVFSAWGAVPAKESIVALTPHLKDEAVQNEAAVAIISVAEKLMEQGDAGKKAAATGLKSVVDNVKDEGIRTRAQEALAKTGIQ